VEREATVDVDGGTDSEYTKFETTETVKVVHDDAEEIGSQADGTVVSVRNATDEFGEFTTEKTTRTSEKDVVVGPDLSKNAFESASTIKVLHDSAAEALTVTPADHTVEEVRNQMDEFGEFTTAKTIRTATEAALGTDTRYLKTETDATVKVLHDPALETGSQADGTIVEVGNKKDEFGDFTTSKRTRTANKDTAAGTDERYTKFESSETVKVTHDDEPESGSQADGTIVAVSNDLDEFGEYKTAKQTRTAEKDVDGGTDSEYTKFETTETVKVVHDDAQETGSQADGTVVSVRNSTDEFGEFSTAKTTKTAIEVAGGTDATENLFESSSTVKVVHDAAEETATFTEGTSIEEVRNQADEFGEFTTAKTTRTPTAVSDAQKEYVKAAAYSDEKTKGVHQASAATVPTQEDGKLKTVVSTKDEFGAYQTDQSTRKFTDISISAYDAIKTPKGSSTREVIEGSANIPTLTEDYGRLTYRKNPISGLYDGEKVVTTYYTAPGIRTTPSTITGKFEYTLIRIGEKWRWEKRTYTISYETSESKAYTAISGGYDGSRVWHSYPNAWSAKKVTDITAEAYWSTGAIIAPTI